MSKTLTEQKLHSTTLPTLRLRSAGSAAATAAATPASAKSGVKRLGLHPVKPRAIPRRSESLFHSKTCNLPRRCRALIFGLTYEALECREAGIETLTGCHNDARDFAKLLRDQYGWEDITVMADEERNRGTELWPSEVNMMSQLRNLVADACLGDMFVVYYAGHSGQLLARDDGHEVDGYDEHMIPVDGRIILDDDLRKTLIDPLPNGTRLTAIFDSCHSGTMLDLGFYPSAARRSDEMHRRRTIDVERPPIRSHTMPTPVTTFWTATKKLKRFPWTAIGRACARLYLILKRNARPKITIIDPRTRLIASEEAPATLGALTMELTLRVNITPSDNSSFITDRTPSTHGEPAIYDEPEVVISPVPIVEESKANGQVACKDCDLLATLHPIVNSIAACQDNQQSLEDTRKKASIMTPALIGLLTSEPDLSARQIQKKLQPKLFQACCRFIVDRLRNMKRPCSRRRLQRKILTIVDEMPWQSVQSGSEYDQHMDEPVLLCRPGWERG